MKRQLVCRLILCLLVLSLMFIVGCGMPMKGHISIRSATIDQHGFCSVVLDVLNCGRMDFALLRTQAVYPELDVQVFAVENRKRKQFKRLSIAGINSMAEMNEADLVALKPFMPIRLFVPFDVDDYQENENLVVSILSPFDNSYRVESMLARRHNEPLAGKAAMPYPRLSIGDIKLLKGKVESLSPYK